MPYARACSRTMVGFLLCFEINLDLSNELPPEVIYDRQSKVVCVSAPALTGDPVPGIITSVLLGDITDPQDQVVFNSALA